MKSPIEGPIESDTPSPIESDIPSPTESDIPSPTESDIPSPLGYKIEYFIQTIGSKERVEIIKKNKLLFPDFKILNAINGYNPEFTIFQLKLSKIKFINLEFKTYGTLANFLTKIGAFKYQVENNLEYMCLIEDDLLLEPNFKEYIESNLHLLEDCNMLRLDNWGEGYVTSIEGAKNILNKIYYYGILLNIDNQLRLLSGKEIKLDDTPWTLQIEGNEGDCLKTRQISKNEIWKLQNLL